MYRAMAWYMLAAGVDVTDPDAVAQRAAEPQVSSTTDPDAPGIWVNGVDVAGPIRGAEVTGHYTSRPPAGPAGGFPPRRYNRRTARPRGARHGT